MKKLIIILILFTFLFSCEKENEPSLTTSKATNENNKDSNTFTNIDTLYWGTYKGVAVSKKDYSAIFNISILSDTSGSCRLLINDRLFNLQFDTSILVRNNRNVHYSTENLSLVISTSNTNPIVTIDYNDIDFMVYALKEEINNTVFLYQGVWNATVKTPISTFEEKGLWNLVHNSKEILGTNGEGPIKGTISPTGEYSGTHNNVTFTGFKTDTTLSGTFKWTAFGVGGTGNWDTEQVFLSSQFAN